MKKLLLFALLVTITTLQSCSEQKSTAIEDAVMYFNDNQFEKTLIIVNEILLDNPQDYFAYSVQGRAFFALGKPIDGIESMSKAIYLNPEYYQAFAYRSTMYKSIGEPQKALDDVEIALKNDATNIDLIKIQASILYSLGENERAIEVFNELLKLEPKDAESLVYRAILQKRLRNYDATLTDLEKAIAINPNYDFAYEARADFYTYSLAENFEQAIKDYDKVINNFKDDVPSQNKAYVFNNRGFAKYQANDFDGAIEDINTSIQLFPKNAYAYKNRALVHLSSDNVASMCADLAKAKALNFEDKYGQEVNNLIQENCK